MRNLVSLRDSLTLLRGWESSAVAVDYNTSTGELLVLSHHGQVKIIDVESNEFNEMEGQSWDLSMSGDSDVDHTWFDLVALRGNGSIICISRAGLIVSIPLDLVSGKWSPEVIVEGDVEGGIGHAAWSPDQSRLVIVTNNNTILSMNSEWDVLEEVPLVEPRAPGTNIEISWRGNGEQFALQSIDSSTGTSNVRVYSNDIELLSTGRNIADGPASILKGVGNSVAFATNGSLIAFPQERIRGKLQIAFIEKNGLRHGDFDLVLSKLPPGYVKWSVASLEWDLPSSLLAVEICALKEDEDDEKVGKGTGRPSIVQMYYRGNYHWYLKQQWSGRDLRILRFDSEASNRCYLSQQPTSTSEGKGSSTPALRIIDLLWDVTCNETRDASVAVADGEKMLLTPLGYSIVPPPMSSSQVPLPSSHKYASFWSNPAASRAMGEQKQGQDSEKMEAMYSSGLVVLSEGLNVDADWAAVNEAINVYHLSLFFLDARGNCKWSVNASLSTSIGEIRGINYRAVLALPPVTAAPGDLEGMECILLGSVDGVDVLVHAAMSLDGYQCNCSLLRQRGDAGMAPESTRNLSPEDAKSQKLVHSRPGGEHGHFALLTNRNGNCEVQSFQLEMNDDSGSGQVSARCSEIMHLLPEDCSEASLLAGSIPIATSQAGSASTGDGVDTGAYDEVSVPLCIGLSSRNRLYSGEMTLATGVGSYAVNEALSVLLYVTTGTSPHLHFVSLRALAALDPDRDVDQEEGVFQLLEFAPPRPVERGAKLVCSVPGDSRVVVQQPRGNLEAFEPRPLVLSRARQLIDDPQGGKYLECLQLLRRQKVDLNFLVDYNPQRFITYAASFMRECVSNGDLKIVDMACLWISTLVDGNASVYKYPLPVIQRLLQVAGPVGDQPSSTTDDYVKVEQLGTYLASDSAEGKVNVLCQILRVSLQRLLDEGHTGALRPLLCTLAKQHPPRLTEALDIIRSAGNTTETSADSNNNNNNGRTSLASSKVQGLIRYLVFLADSEQIFNAALASCDFAMSRAIARQCQMDPKTYLPLLEGFEAIGKQGGGVAGSYEHWVMHLAVALHLKRPTMVIECGVEALSVGTYSSNANANANALPPPPEEGKNNGSNNPTSTTVPVLGLVEVGEEVVKAAREGKLYSTALPLVLKAKKSSSNKEQNQGGNASVLSSVLSNLRYDYAIYLKKQKNPLLGQVVTLLLLVEPPRVKEAVDVSVEMGDIQQAMFLCGKFFKNPLTPNVVAPSVLAQTIVNQYEASLVGTPALLDLALDGCDISIEGLTGSGTVSRAEEIANLYLNYRDGDVESAVSILLKNRELMLAAQTAMRCGRQDLLNDDVNRAVRQAAYEFVIGLKKVENSVKETVQMLEELWNEPEKRLAAARESDAEIARELDWLEGGGDADEYDPSKVDGEGADTDDTKSEFSMASMRSDLSFVSGLSTVLSEISGLSAASSSSRASRAGSATVSVLSEMKLDKKSSVGGANNSDGQGSSFSINGLEHSLLSRGSGKYDASLGGRAAWEDNGEEQLSKRQLRRKHRALTKPHSSLFKDTLGFAKESKACQELYRLAHVYRIASKCIEVCRVLLLVGGAHATELAARVQRAMDSYTETLRSHPPPVAPLYPRKWLASKDMTILRKFQETTNGGDAAAVKKWESTHAGASIGTASFWALAAEGISSWHTKQRLAALGDLDDLDGGEDEAMAMLAANVAADGDY